MQFWVLEKSLLYEEMFLWTWTEETLIGNDLFPVIAIMKYSYTIYNMTFKMKLHVIVLFVNFRLSDWFVFVPY